MGIPLIRANSQFVELPIPVDENRRTRFVLIRKGVPQLFYFEGVAMGLNSQMDIEADLQVGPTDKGMVRIYVKGPEVDLPLDFDPEDAEAIAEELKAAAQAAREMK